jgi:hypothetical protein
MPSDTDSLLNLLREALSSDGLVHKIVCEEGQLVRIYRWVEDDGMSEVGLDIEGALRNAEFVEYSVEGGGPFEAIWDMIALVRAEKLWPTCWVTGQKETNLLDTWLEMSERGRPWDLKTMLGLPVHHVDFLEESTLILCASVFKEAEPENVSFVVKTAIEVEVEDGDTSSPTPDPVRSHPRERPPPARKVEDLRQEGPRSDSGWEPSDLFVSWMGDSRPIR